MLWLLYQPKSEVMVGGTSSIPLPHSVTSSPWHWMIPWPMTTSEKPSPHSHNVHIWHLRTVVAIDICKYWKTCMQTVFESSCCHWLKRRFLCRTNVGKSVYCVCIENLMYTTKMENLMESNKRKKTWNHDIMYNIYIYLFIYLFIYMINISHINSSHIMTLSVFSAYIQTSDPFLTPRYTSSEYSSPNLYRPHHSLVPGPKFHQPHLKVISKTFQVPCLETNIHPWKLTNRPWK